ncbi:hypothetical protein G4B88_026524 [Cannabis sativa]|uniref:BED-type domain-containing protein n=1 Tax=Cannabis sativa TaxID=3483 RepID=A0A7J6GR09_CANSA|nr:hypothetical protein G4B88_026524 [Cannabis sativa]
MVIDEMVDESTPSPEVNQSPTETPNEDENKDKSKGKKRGKSPTVVRDEKGTLIWEHFTKLEPTDPEDFDEDILKYICKYCDKDFTCDCRNFDTSHLWNHFNNGCEFSPAKEGLDKKQKYFIQISGLQYWLYGLSLDEDEDQLKNMKMKYDKYWRSIDKCNEALLIALVLDPRYKLRYLKHCFSYFHDSNTTNEMVKRVEQIVQAMYDHYGGVTTSFDQFQSQAIVIMLLVMLNLHPHLQSTEKNLGTEFT